NDPCSKNIKSYFCPSRRHADQTYSINDKVDDPPLGPRPGGLSDYASCGGSSGSNGALMVSKAIGKLPDGGYISADWNSSPVGDNRDIVEFANRVQQDHRRSEQHPSGRRKARSPEFAMGQERGSQRLLRRQRQQLPPARRGEQALDRGNRHPGDRRGPTRSGWAAGRLAVRQPPP